MPLHFGSIGPFHSQSLGINLEGTTANPETSHRLTPELWYGESHLQRT